MIQGQHLAFRPSHVVGERLRALGRTEDVMFSPDQTRLAIAGFTQDKVLVLRIEVVTDDGVLTVRSDSCVELHSPDFKRPHGLFWVDDSTLAVANRGKDVIVVPVPAVGATGEAVDVEPLLRLGEGGDGIISTPGSVAVIRLEDGYFDFLVCNNYRNHVSRHIVLARNGYEVASSHRLFAHGLRIPDGIAVSSDGDLVAVSNHDGRRIDVFRHNGGSLGQSRPAFSLGIPNYPHGVRFAMDDRLVLVADAGAPLVHVFARNGETWHPSRNPLLSVQVMDDESFQRGRTNPAEGGPKGLDIRADGSLFVVSCEEAPIAFFDFRAVRDQLVGPDAPDYRQPRSGDGRLLEATLAAMKGQRDEIVTLQAKITQLKALRDRSFDRRLLRLVRRGALKVLNLTGKREY